jgi:hypothetical protein
MTVGDTLIAFALLAIVVILVCEACWRARFPRWPFSGWRNAGWRGAVGDTSNGPRRSAKRV